MYNLFQTGIKFLKYIFLAKNGKGHGIHSPFVFDFVIKVLNDTTKYKDYNIIENHRKKLKENKRVLNIHDYGAGAVKGTEKKDSIANIVSRTAKPPKYAQLLYRIAAYFQPACMLELGTSLGVSSMYLSMGNPQGKLYTIEGAKEIAAEAEKNFEKLGLHQITSITGKFEEVLPELLQNIPSPDLVFIDGNHKKEPTIAYFKQLLPLCKSSTVLIFDDIHWSTEMEEAWNLIKQQKEVKLTIDLFFIGLVFFREEYTEQQHFMIRF